HGKSPRESPRSVAVWSVAERDVLGLSSLNDDLSLRTGAACGVASENQATPPCRCLKPLGGGAPNEGLDREELWLRLPAPVGSGRFHGRSEFLLDKALKVFLRLPDVIDVPALFAWASRVQNQSVRRLPFRHWMAAEHLLGE